MKINTFEVEQYECLQAGDFIDRPIPDCDDSKENAAQWIEQNMKLLQFLVHTYAKDGDFEDIFQEACLTAFTAYSKYDKNRVDCKLSTFISECVRRRIWMIHREENAQFRTADVIHFEDYYKQAQRVAMSNSSLYDDVLTEPDYDFVSSEVSTERQALAKVQLAEVDSIVRTYFNQTQGTIIKLTAIGESQQEISKCLGISQSRVSVYLNEARETIRHYLENKEACLA